MSSYPLDVQQLKRKSVSAYPHQVNENMMKDTERLFSLHSYIFNGK